jgi:hypothetical protein
MNQILGANPCAKVATFAQGFINLDPAFRHSFFSYQIYHREV